MVEEAETNSFFSKMISSVICVILNQASLDFVVQVTFHTRL